MILHVQAVFDQTLHTIAKNKITLGCSLRLEARTLHQNEPYDVSCNCECSAEFFHFSDTFVFVREQLIEKFIVV